MSSPQPSNSDQPVGDETNLSPELRFAPDDSWNERTDDWKDIAKGTQPHGSGSSDGELPDTESSSARVEALESEHARSLRSKIVLALAVVLTIAVGIDEVVRQQVIAPEFASLERVTAMKETNRVLSAINTEIEYLAESAVQDRARRMLVSHYNAHASDLPPSPDLDPYNQSRIEWSAIIQPDNGRWDWAERPDDNAVAGSSKTPSPDRGLFDLSSYLSGSTNDLEDELQGIVRGDDGQLYLFAARQLSPGSGRPTSYLVVGREFGKKMIAEIVDRTSVQFDVQPTNRRDHEVQITFAQAGQSLLLVGSPLISLDGKPLAELQVRLPREFMNRSRQTTAFARYLSLCGACASLLVLLLLLQRIVIGRLQAIREHTERIASSVSPSDGESLPPLKVSGRDEIAQLSLSIDRMQSRLGDAQQRLSDASHAAGMSLVAETVIHNVGNVLTNVNSLIETATNRVEALRIEPLERLADRLDSGEIDEAMRRETPQYLNRLSKTLSRDRDELASLLETLDDNVQHIHQVIRDQRQHAHQPVAWQKVNLGQIMDEAIRCSRAKLQQDNVQVQLRCNVDTPIWTDRTLLMQILINVIANAGAATHNCHDRPPKLEIDAIRTQSSVHLRFRDNGCGMDAQTRSRVFDAHFTTRLSGSGLGLHFCAIAAKRIGGSIHADSDGPDQGATFLIKLPLNKPTTNQATRKEVGESSQSDRPCDNEPMNQPLLSVGSSDE